MRIRKSHKFRRAALPTLLVTAAAITCNLLPHGQTALADSNPPGPPAPPPLSWPLENPMVETQGVGYLPGGGSVSPAGDYRYNLPIDAPDGRAGKAPNLALGYSSRGGNGLLGVGWSVSYGGSTISRCHKTFNIDQTADAPNYGADDAICLDGQRLIKVNAALPMSEGAEYRTYRDSFTKVVAHGGQNESAAWFEVFGKDGSIRVYTALYAKRLPPVIDESEPGNPNTVAAVWVLTEERDRDGNAILYNYEQEPDAAAPYSFEYRIASIEYTAKKDSSGNLEKSPQRKVLFEYSQTRPDPSFSYESGVRTAVTKRLDRIKLLAPNPSTQEVIGRYELVYEQGQERTYLEAVHRYDATGQVRLWERSFEWAHAQAPEFQVSEPAQLVGAFHEGMPILFDADNDGKQDLLVDGKFCRTTAGSTTPFNSCISGNATVGIEGRPIDVDGNGKTDILRNTGSGSFYHTWNSTTDTFEPTPYGVVSTTNLIDADGDGLPDAFVLVPIPNPIDDNDRQWALRLNTGTGLGPAMTPAQPVPSRLYQRKQVALDLNGDGRGELHSGYHPSDEPPSECAGNPTPPWEYAALGLTDSNTLFHRVYTPQGSACTKMLIDLNHDGLEDQLVIAGQNGIVKYNTGTRFLPGEPFDLGETIYPRLGKQDLEAVDVNGDGRTDMISTKEASVLNGQDHLPNTYLHLRQQNGFSRFDLGAAPYNIPAYDPQDFPPHQENQSPIVKPADVNGDGLLDLVVVIRDRAANTSKVRVLAQEWQPKDVIVGVWDEPHTSPRESVFYSPFPSDSPTLTDCAYPVRCLRGGMTVAREHWIHRQDVPGAVRRTGYQFDDARTEVRGRGMLGFGTMRTMDLDSFAETIVQFYNDESANGLYPFAGMPRDTWRITPILRTDIEPTGGVILPAAGARITARVIHTHHDYELRYTNTGLTHAVFPGAEVAEEWEQHVTISTVGNTLLNDGSATLPRVTHRAWNFDDFGNTTFSSEWADGGDLCQTFSTVQNDPSNWLLGLVQSTAVTCNKMGNPLPEPRLQTFTYNTKGQLVTTVVEPNHPALSTTTTVDRNSDGLVIKTTVSAAGEQPRTVHIAYDEEGVYARATWNALGHTNRQLVHPALGVPVVAEAPNGTQIRYRYDGFGRIRETIPDDGPSRTISYQEAPTEPWAIETVEVRQEGGNTHTVSDEFGRVLTTATTGFDGQWVHSKVTYNLFGQTTKAFRPASGQAPTLYTSTVFDTLGRAVTVTEPNGAVTEHAYTMFETVTTDPEGHQTKNVRDMNNRPVFSADMVNGQWVGITYLYGEFSQLVDAVDPVGNIVHTEYDKLGRRIALSDPDRGLTTWEHNPFGEVVVETDALGDSMTLVRDVLGRVTASTHDLNGVTTFAYDGAGAPEQLGRLTSATSPDGVTTAYEYDSFGRNTRTIWTVLGTQTYDIAREYDLYSRLSMLRYPEVPGRQPFTAQYEYNAFGYGHRVNDATDRENPLPLWELTGRNADGMMTTSNVANGVGESRMYDPATGRLYHVEAVKNGSALYSMDYTRDLTGNITTRVDNALSVPRTEAFAYDELDRLTYWGVTFEGEPREVNYSYDLIGNLTTINHAGLLETHTHGIVQGSQVGMPHALASRTKGSQVFTYTYDARGRQLTGDGREIAWKPFDLPAHISQSGSVHTFRYDAFGKRIRKQTLTGGVATSTTDTIGGIYERRAVAGASIEHVFYVNGSDGPVAQIVYNEATGTDETLYLHSEALGSVGLVTDNQGVETERTFFDPFGEKVKDTGDATSPLLGDVKLGFTGHRHDDDLGLINMIGRIYSPVQKRFLSTDPMISDPFFGQSYNRYSYVVNNPLRYTDPTGYHKALPQGVAPAPPANGPVRATVSLPDVYIFGTIRKPTEKADDTEPPPPPPPPPPSEPRDETKWFDFIARMSAYRAASGAFHQFNDKMPWNTLPAAQAEQDRILTAAVGQAAQGEWEGAAYTALELPFQGAMMAGGLIIGPVRAIQSLPTQVGILVDPNSTPEDRGAAAVEVVDEIVTVVASATVVAGAVKGVASPKSAGGLSPRAARREAMREAGIPTSQQPVSQQSTRVPGTNQPGGRQYTYNVSGAGGATREMSVQHSLTDRVEGHGPHWEAGSTKGSGRTDPLGRPKLGNNKVKVEE